MISKINALVAILLFSLAIVACELPEEGDPDYWAKFYDISTTWTSNYAVNARVPVQTANGGYVFAGNAYYTKMAGIGSVNKYDDIAFVKLNALGEVEKALTFTDPDSISSGIVHSLKAVSDGYIMAGTTEGFGEGLIDTWVVKLSHGGGIQWEKVLSAGQFSITEAALLVEGSDGYLLAGGGINGREIAMLDKSGALIWAYELDGAYSIKSLIAAHDGGYLAAVSRLGGRAFLAWIDEDGAFTSTKEYISQEGDAIALNTLWAADDGTYMAGGAWADEANSSPKNYCIISIDSEGEIIWQQMTVDYGELENGITAITQLDDGSFIAAGTLSSLTPERERTEILITKFTTDGTIHWRKRYQANHSLRNGSVASTSKGFMVAGNYGDQALLMSCDGNGDISGHGELIDITEVDHHTVPMGLVAVLGDDIETVSSPITVEDTRASVYEMKTTSGRL